MEEKKKLIAKCIYDALNNTEITIDEIEAKVEVPKDKQNGDFSYPCFNLAKIMKNSPVNIANTIKGNYTLRLYIIDCVYSGDIYLR